jgi:hypothetical protein
MRFIGNPRVNLECGPAQPNLFSNKMNQRPQENLVVGVVECNIFNFNSQIKGSEKPTMLSCERVITIVSLRVNYFEKLIASSFNHIRFLSMQCLILGSECSI